MALFVLFLFPFFVYLVGSLVTLTKPTSVLDYSVLLISTPHALARLLISHYYDLVNS